MPAPEPPRIHWRMKLAMPYLLIIPTLTAWFFWQDFRSREAVGRVVADNQPVAHAIVKLNDRTVRTDEQGIFRVPFKNEDMPLPLLVEMNGYVPSRSHVGQTILENKKWFYLAPIKWDIQYQLGDVQLEKETVPITPPSPPPASVQEPTPPKLNLEKLRTVPPPVPAWWEQLSPKDPVVAITEVVLVVLPAFMMVWFYDFLSLEMFWPWPLVLLAIVSWPSALLFWFFSRFSRRAVLKRQSSLIPPELKRVQILAGTQRLFPTLSLRYVTQRLRQTRFEESTELDVARTIQLTMHRGGLFTPVFGSKREPSYVALIDRATPADHQANVAAQVVRDLAKGYVLLRQYEFDEQPTVLRKVDPFHAKSHQNEGATVVATRLEIMSLGEVTAKFPTSRLLCFAEPMTCFDPLSGKLRPWVETLESWEQRFLFTPGTRAQWGQAERILSRRGFHVIPLTHLGLQLFPQLLEQDSSQGESTEATTGKRRGTYERMPQRWLERHPPSQDTIAKLITDLRKELGSEGILWLAACAAYPEIHWALTLEWGVRLFGHSSAAEALLPKLTPLVWFRHAFMPDWFRSALYDQLTAPEAERISQELGEIISALNPESGDTLQLKIATPSGAKQQAAPPSGWFSAWLQKFRRRSAIQAMGRAADQGNPMRDYVMLQYLSGKQGKALTPYAPKALRTLLFPKGQPWLGFRPLFLMIVACVVSASLWWWQDPAPIPVPSPIVDIGFLSDSTEVILKREDGRVERWGEKERELVLLESGMENAFADRLTKVKMGQLTVLDPKGHLEVAYQKTGQLGVTSREDGRELAREPAPAAQVASLHWPKDSDALLVVASAGTPEVVKARGIEGFRQWEVMIRHRGKNEAVAVRKSTEPSTQKQSQTRQQPIKQSDERGKEPRRPIDAPLGEPDYPGGVVKITTHRTNVGAGFIVQLKQSAAYIITASAVIESDPNPAVKFFFDRERSYLGRVKNVERQALGLALIEVEIPHSNLAQLHALPLDTGSSFVGGKAIDMIGFPHFGEGWTSTYGMIVSREGGILNIDAKIEKGYLGSPILDRERVVGLVVGQGRRALAVTAGTLQDYLERVGIALQQNGSPQRTGAMEIARKGSLDHYPAVQSLESTQQDALKQADQSQQVQPVGKYPSRSTDKDGAPMVLVPAGEFTMGTGEDDTSAPNDERPSHLVSLDDFFIDQYEVTTAQYAKFIEEERQSEPAAWSADVVKRHARKPVVGVSWKDATAYCTWAGKRLPTEAEWEKAARGTDQGLYPWGNVAPGSLANFSHCCDFNNYEVLSDVGYFNGGKSPYGAYDMAGNAWEWVADWYDENYYSKSPADNPKGPLSGEYRVLRGGAWTLQSSSLRTTSRHKATPKSRNYTDVGFRCAQDAPK